MKRSPLFLAALALAPHLCAALPTFRSAPVPEGWILVKGQSDLGAVRNARPAAPMELCTETPVALPIEANFDLRVAPGDSLMIVARENALESKETKPLLSFMVRMAETGKAQISVQAGGEPMKTTAIHQRGWTSILKPTGALTYGWRFPKVKNLWDELDRKEVGATYATLVPFEERVMHLRMVLATGRCQIWLDDRFVAEETVPLPAHAHFALAFPAKSNAQVLSARFEQPIETGRFTPVRLSHWSHAKAALPAEEAVAVSQIEGVPAALAPERNALNLGDSLYRYRRTSGSGPNASYVEANASWPGAFDIDPASLTFRVPYRNYQTAWLVAWLEEAPGAVPRGTFRFYRPAGGYPAQTDFEITPEAIARGEVKPLKQTTASGKALYLVRVPLDTQGLYGMRDLEGQFLDFELSKPVVLGRSYPDPIYYGFHPAGPRSSVRVAGITLEQASFEMEIKPRQTAFVFEQPQKPVLDVAVKNTGPSVLDAKVTLVTRSYDSSEKTSLSKTVRIPAGQTLTPELTPDLKKLGWHELSFSVEAAGVSRRATLSTVLLPPNTRSYGEHDNETRFGTWNLLGHYTPIRPAAADPNGENEQMLAMLRKLGLRRISISNGWVTEELAKKYDFLPVGPHTVINVVYRWKKDDLEAQDKMVAVELAAMKDLARQEKRPTYFYGGEWHVGKLAQYAAWPYYTGDGDRDLNEEERRMVDQQVPIFTKIGRALHKDFPQSRLFLQWGAPLGTLAHIRGGIPKDVVDGYGMDAPMFELLPELSNMTGSINNLWYFRQEIKRLGWPNLPMRWCEGPFFPTNPGALSEEDQMNSQVRYLLLGMCYGVDAFESGIVPFDAGNYYGAEHYGAGVFHRIPLVCPKPAVAAIATMTSMLCGAERAGNVETGSLTDYCVAFKKAADNRHVFALWRVQGEVPATLSVKGGGAPVLTDSMGNTTTLKVVDGKIRFTITPTPKWLTGVDAVESIQLGEAVFPEKPAPHAMPLVEFSVAKWEYDGGPDPDYATHHFSVRRITDPALRAEFGQGEEGHPDALAIVLPAGPADKPMATRYGALKLKKAVPIAGKPAALGVWIKGNSSWGRVVYQLKDAKGETWISHGTKDDWNCDDPHAWSYVSFNGWRYVRFPLPSSHPWDSARGLDTTWWASRGGDGVVDYPLSLEKILVEARNEVPWCGEMRPVTVRAYKLGGLTVEYEGEPEMKPAFLTRYSQKLPVPAWTGPSDNPIARLKAAGVDEAPDIREFTEPKQFNDGRRMLIHFEAKPERTYNLYLSIYPDGRGADLLKAGVKADEQVVGFRPGVDMYLFLTELDAKKNESKPSKPFKLVTQDNFAEK